MTFPDWLRLFYWHTRETRRWVSFDTLYWLWRAGNSPEDAAQLNQKIGDRGLDFPPLGPYPYISPDNL